MLVPARIDEAEPFGDVGRLHALRITARIAGVPSLGMYLFEAGISDAEAIHRFAVAYGVKPRPAPFQRLIDDPAPRAGD